MSEVDDLNISFELHSDKLVVKLTRCGKLFREFISADAISLDDLRRALASAPAQNTCPHCGKVLGACDRDFHVPACRPQPKDTGQ